jgi:rifampicin phosphotransferase
LAALSLPMQTLTTRINTYFYMAIAPNVPPEMMPEMEAKAEPVLMGAIPAFWERWQTEWLPEVKQTWDDWSAFDLSAASDVELVARTQKAVEVYQRVWTIHFEMLIPAMVAGSAFQDLYTALFPGNGPLDAYRLCQGFDNMSLEAGRKLWALSRQARADSALARLIETTPARSLPAALEGTDAGRAFLASLNDYLAFYGRRSDTVQELGDPSWTEDPTPALDNIKAYLAQDEDPDDVLRKAAIEREGLIAAARESLKNHPEDVRGQFEVLLAAAQNFSRVQEDHNFWIDQRSLHEIRQFCRDFGRRLAERGVLEQTNDIFLLDMNEARDFLLATQADARPLVAERRAEMNRWRKIPAPPLIGMDYGPPPDNPVTRALNRFFSPPKGPSAVATEVPGNPGSRGKVKGTARVIMTIADSGRLEFGDILVTATTSPPWTPLFATAGGIVTDTGGELSHCAIVAREYGIPAVVGATGATSTIKDGSLIEVDGDTGMVYILS